MKQLAAFFWAAFWATLWATTAPAQPVRIFSSWDIASAIPGGIEVHGGSAVMRVTALRDDVIRVRFGPGARLPEDASWAVLPSARTAQVPVTPAIDSASAGFATAKVRVRVEKSTLRISVSDLAGNVISSDAPGRPLEYHGDSFRLYKEMPADEHYYGLGDKTGSFDRRSSSFTLWNTDQGIQESSDPNYKSIPFVIGYRTGGRSYGILFDNTWRSTFDFGKEVRDAWSYGAEGGPVDYYIMYGPEPKQVVETYAWLTGTPPMPPLWALGYQQSRYSYETEAKVRAVTSRLRADRIPVDAVYLDIDYQNKNRPFTVDEKSFPDMPRLVADLKSQRIRLVMITDLHIANLPNADYQPYDEGIQGGHFVKNPDGSVYSGIVWPGPAVFPDFTHVESRAWWGSLYRNFYAYGVSGFWNDMNEPAVFQSSTKTIPLDVTGRLNEPGFEPRTVTQREAHNIFGMLNTRGTYEGLLKLNPDQRPFVLTRATYAGGHRYAATWTGDNNSTWNNLRLSVPMLLNLGLSGFGMVGDDIGGFGGSPSMELLTRWFEVGAFNPIFRDHTDKGSNPQEPWVGGPEHEAIRKRYIEERYRLLPYIYTLAEENARTGIPLMRPLFLEFPHVDMDAANEFMWGSSLLVAPALFWEMPQNYNVHLPAGDWFDYWTGRRVVGKAPGGESVVTGAQKGPVKVIEVEVKPVLSELPVYVRGGSIVPLQSLVQSTGETPRGPLELRVFPGPGCSGSLYQDDGISFAYRKGEFYRQAFRCDATPQNVQVNFAAHEGTWKPWWTETEVVVYDWQTAFPVVTLNGKPVAGARYDASRKALRIRIPEQGNGGELRIAAR